LKAVWFFIIIDNIGENKIMLLAELETPVAELRKKINETWGRL
jgi:hypothetical protein